MNIFKILSSGDGAIKEPNISAFLGYLLDPNKEHGLKDFLLKEILKPLVMNTDKFPKLLINENIVNLTNDSKFKVDVELERRVRSQAGSRKIDIVITIYDFVEPVCIICIENKIKSSSVTKNQLKEQFEGILLEYPNIPIGFVYLTPVKVKSSVDEYQDFKNEYEDIPSYHLQWNGDDESIHSLLTTMLLDESKGMIEPIFEYSKYTIKAFINFIDSGFQSYVEEKSNINKKIKYKQPIREYIREVYENLEDNTEYTIDVIKNQISERVIKDNGLAINKGTLTAQLYMSIVNEKNRIHYNVNEKNHTKFDLFYYTADNKEKIKKYNSNVDVAVIFKT